MTASTSAPPGELESAGDPSTSARGRTIAWVGPFAAFMLWLALDRYIPLANPAKEIVRALYLAAAILIFSRHVLPRSAPRWLPSIGVGLAVFALWIAPDALFPGWREHWLFQNGVTGRLKTSIPPAELTPLMLTLRTMRAALLVPILEELFWRGWLPRWVQDPRFERIPLGRYTTLAFVSTALLFAAEHGPYWEVGLVAGVIYNWWMWKSRSLGDLILAHAVTNLALSLYVIGTGTWTYWM